MRNIFLSFMVGLTCLAFQVNPAYAAVEVNKEAPDFTLTDSTGEEHTLSDYRGKYVVLEWVNYECPFVIKHYSSDNMQSLQKEMTSNDIVWFSINSSDKDKQGHYSSDKINALLKEKGASPTAYLMDTSGDVGKTYGAKTTPHMFVINPEGNVIYQGAIDDNPSFDPEDIKDSKNYVRAALTQDQNGEAVADSVTKSYGCSVKY